MSIDTNNPQGMQLGRFKNRTPARFEYIYYTFFWNFSDPIVEVNAVVRHFLVRKKWQYMCENLKILEN
jgi:hypothetical protein